jgi:hypothetical protein
MRMKPVLRIAALAALMLVAARSAHASLVVALDLETMVSRADHIAVVDVTTVSAAWDAKHERILTTIDLAVVEAWKGPLAPAMHVKIVQPGGSVGDIQMTVFGMTHFTPGERALVFLRGTPDAAAVVGMAQGKRLLRQDTTTNRWLVHAPDRAGASFVRAAAKTTTTTTPPVFDARVRALEDVRTEVRDLVGKATSR